MKIGDRLWNFDADIRVYTRDAHGRPTGPALWRAKWVEHEVVGETVRSWIVAKAGTSSTHYSAVKIPKKGSEASLPSGWAFSEREIERLQWFEENHYEIGQAVTRLQDVELLGKVAQLIGFNPLPPS